MLKAIPSDGIRCGMAYAQLPCPQPQQHCELLSRKFLYKRNPSSYDLQECAVLISRLAWGQACNQDKCIYVRVDLHVIKGV